jgi:hypothetical protein
MRLAAGVLAGALSCWAQVGFQPVGGGLVLDGAAGVVRPLLGIPGASRLGPGLGDGLPVSRAALGDAIALAVTAAEPARLRWLSAGSVAAVDLPSEATALFVNRAGTWGFVRTAADELCFVDQTATCKGYRSGPLLAVAEERERCLLAASGDGEVERVCRSDGSRAIGKFSRMPSVLVWLEEGKQLAAAFPDSGTVELLRLSDGAWRALPSPVAAITSMAAVDRERLLLASSELILLQIASGETKSLPMPVAAARLRALPNDIILGEGGEFDPLLLVDATSDFESYLVPLPGAQQ